VRSCAWSSPDATVGAARRELVQRSAASAATVTRSSCTCPGAGSAAGRFRASALIGQPLVSCCRIHVATCRMYSPYHSKVSGTASATRS